MGLLQYVNLEDNTPATANKFNERFAAIIKAINGNIEADNLKNSAVTTAKIANGAVTNDKVANATLTPFKMDGIAFRVTNSEDQTLSQRVSDVVFDTIEYDFGNNFDTDLNAYVAPVRGIYQINARVTFKPDGNIKGDLLAAQLNVNDERELSGNSVVAGDNHSHGLMISGILFLEAGETVKAAAYRENSPYGELTGGQADMSGVCLAAINV